MHRVETKAGIVDYYIKYVGEVTVAQRDKSKSKYDAWEICINGIGTDFKTGLGLRCRNKPKPPCADDVLYNLISDWQCATECFEDFCSELGYDTDSRTALQLYLDCQGIKKKLQQMKLDKTLGELEKLYRDY